MTDYDHRYLVQVPRAICYSAARRVWLYRQTGTRIRRLSWRRGWA